MIKINNQTNEGQHETKDISTNISRLQKSPSPFKYTNYITLFEHDSQKQSIVMKEASDQQ